MYLGECAVDEGQISSTLRVIRYTLFNKFEDKFLYGGENVTPQTFFLNEFFSWNLSFRCFKVHHEFIIIFRNYFSIKWNFRKIYPVKSNSEQL